MLPNTSPSLTITCVEDEQTVVFHAVGQINFTTSEALQLPLLAAAESSLKALALDLGEVDFISSAGLRVLMMAATRLRKRNERLTLRRVQPMVLAVLKMANFTRFLDIAP